MKGKCFLFAITFLWEISLCLFVSPALEKSVAFVKLPLKSSTTVIIIVSCHAISGTGPAFYSIYFLFSRDS